MTLPRPDTHPVSSPRPFPACSLARSDAGAVAPALPAADAYQACTSPARLSNLTDGNYLYAGECHVSCNSASAWACS